MDLKDTIKAVQTKLGIDNDGVAGAETWLAVYNSIVGRGDGAETFDIDTLVTAIQEALGVDTDGIAGTNTWNAIANKLLVNVGPASVEPPVTTGDIDNSPVDSRSETNISALLPVVQPLARTLVHKAAAAGITIKVISGLRTYAEQDALYAQGRTTPGNIVTNAKAGFSNHNFGLAFDIGIFEGASYLDESPKYKTVGAIGEGIGLTWGGSWTSIQDEPHFELRPGWATQLSENDMLAALRERKDNGQDLMA